jgi:hypothetical protein
MTRIALVHALSHSVAPINEAFARDWPEAVRMNLLDDSLSADLARYGRGLDAAMHERFQRLAQYAVDTGAEGILFTCSAFGPCIEAVAQRHAGIPVLKPNEAMIAEAMQGEGRLGLIATFAPTLASMPPEFPAGAALELALAEGALDALNAGDTKRHDALIAAQRRGAARSRLHAHRARAIQHGARQCGLCRGQRPAGAYDGRQRSARAAPANGPAALSVSRRGRWR